MATNKPKTKVDTLIENQLVQLRDAKTQKRNQIGVMNKLESRIEGLLLEAEIKILDSQIDFLNDLQREMNRPKPKKKKLLTESN